ncbi:MAG: hypothetical protein J5517_04350 [Eubacterium sp.]|nr:hypothetical protein [Eubacterium sp.]
MKKRYLKLVALMLSLGMVMGLSACGSDDIDEELALIEEEDDYDEDDEDFEEDEDGDFEEILEGDDDYEELAPTKESISITHTFEDSTDGGHVAEADSEELYYTTSKIVKTGNAEGDEADFYGENAACLATNGGTVDISKSIIETNGKHANALFSYGEGSTVSISDSVIETTGDCSGGLMTTGGGTTTARNLRITTSGNSSAAIRSDRGGGTVEVDGGVYTTSGMGSPVIYSTADITVTDATMESTSSQGVVVEGKNSVTLEAVDLTADNNTQNSDKSDYYQAVMIYQSMSGDAAEGTASFTMSDSLLTNKKGDIFFVNNTVAVITLLNNEFINEDEDGVFLRAAGAGWGQSGSNGGNVTLKVGEQVIDGDIIVDDVSTLNMYLASESEFRGAINPDGQAGDVYVEITGDSKWILTGDSYISSLTCDASAINLNGHKLYVDGKEYKAGTESSGEAVEAKVSEGGGMEAPPDGGQGDMGNPPDGAPGDGNPPDGEPPEKPDGDNGNPPEKPDGDSSGPGNGNPPDGEPPEKPE